MRNALNFKICLLLTFLSFIPINNVFPQNGITVKGKVIDEALKEAVPGTNVIVKGTQIGAITDVSGNYTIVVPGKKSVLVFSFMGYVTQEITVNNQKVINVSLKDDSQSLDEVVVIAYGTQNKGLVTSAMSSIDNKELIKSPVASVTNSLAGAVPGVAAIQSSGQPGKDNAAIYVRGSGSLDNSLSQPLILVDGIEREFSQIDPNEIESISVLKDASATAVFGVRGANGVVLVTTRRGTVGKPKISVSTSLGLQQPISDIISKVRTVEFFIQENKELGGNKLKVNVWVDGKKFLETPDRNDVFITEGDKHQKGLMINLQTKSCTNDDYFEIISCEYTPYE